MRCQREYNCKCEECSTFCIGCNKFYHKRNLSVFNSIGAICYECYKQHRMFDTTDLMFELNTINRQNK